MTTLTIRFPLSPRARWALLPFGVGLWLLLWGHHDYATLRDPNAPKSLALGAVAFVLGLAGSALVYLAPAGEAEAPEAD